MLNATLILLEQMENRTSKFDESTEEQLVVRHLTEHSKIQEWNINQLSPDSTSGHQKARSGKRSKRGDSLERKIAKLILNEARHSYKTGFTADGSDVGSLSPTDILRDLNETSVGIFPLSTDLTQTMRWIKNNGKESSTKTDNLIAFDLGSSDRRTRHHVTNGNSNDHLATGKSHSKASASDVFNFNMEDEEWAAFEDQTQLDEPPLPSTRELDGDGFPVSFEGIRIHDDYVSKDAFGFKEGSPPSQPSMSRNAITQKESPVVFPSENSRMDPASSGRSASYLLGNLSEKPQVYGSPQSPSSVTKFAPGCQSNGPDSITIAKFTWNPKPPNHLNQEGFAPDENTTASF